MLFTDIRRGFLKYFKERGHTIVPSSPVVPHDDPTLLFTNAGMNQFKDVFLGKSRPDYTRATTAQKCVRVGGKHNDLDNVGHTSRHLTFFEMLGNFSFGDYFKREAIAFAWEVATTVYGFDPERIWITVFREDEEARTLWQEFVPEKRIALMDEKDNFWEMGPTGPCGPCSELHYDRGETYGTARSPSEDASGERFLEFWNLVFMQYNRDASGKCTPLPKPCIDTGSGLERVVSLKMGVESVFETDLFLALIEEIENVCKKAYPKDDPVLAPAYHVIADHLRTLAFAIADGAQPSNVERGYILRKLLRRAVRYGRMLDLQEPFLARLLPRLIALMGEDFKEIAEARVRIEEILTSEEDAFLRTLKRGGNILNGIIEKAKSSPYKQISGEAAFKLKDTYGFPLEEILLIAKDHELTVNLDAYELLEEQAKERSRAAHVVHEEVASVSLYRPFVDRHGPAAFLGYQELTAKAKVLGLVVNGAFVESVHAGDVADVLLDRTPFYAEKGGQVGDRGVLSHAGARFVVEDCRAPYSGVIAHRGRQELGELKVGDFVTADVDPQRRLRIANNHTATHLLHWALQQVCGPHIRQAGSLVAADHLRFDFTHHKALTREDIRAIERLVNQKIRDNLPVATYELPYDEAQKREDIKQFFGEKYGERVRVVDIDMSKELCGGTHVSACGQIGLFRIHKESSIAKGVRRIDAVTGADAEAFVYAQEDLLYDVAQLVKTSPAQLKEHLAHLLHEHRERAASLKELQRTRLHTLAKELVERALPIGSWTLVTGVVSVSQEELGELADAVHALAPQSAIVLAVRNKERCQLLARMAPDMVRAGLSSQELVRSIAPTIEGSGGGKPERAIAGGKNPARLEAALDLAKQWISSRA